MIDVNPEDLGNTVVFDLKGEEVPLKSVLGEQDTLVVFVRHFGCIFCRTRLAGLDEHIAAFEDVGIKVMVVGNGTVPMAEAFVEETGLNVPLFTDPTGQVYANAGMRRHFGIGPKAMTRAVGAFVRGHRQGRISGDVWQQGGYVVLGQDGQVKIHHADTGAGDRIDFTALISQVKTAA